MRSSEIRLRKLKLRLRHKRFANHKAPCTVIWQQPLQSVATDLFIFILKVPNYRPRRPMRDVNARVHIYTATALGRGRIASPTLGLLYPRILILYEPEWTPGPVWRRRSEEKSPPFRHAGLNLGRPARSQAPCRLSYNHS